MNITYGLNPTQNKIGRIIERNTSEVPISGCLIISMTGNITNAQALINTRGLLTFLYPSSAEDKKFDIARIVAIFANSDG